MSRGAVLLGLVLWAGATLVLAELRWFRRVGLVDRLTPYSPVAPPSTRHRGVSVGSFVEVVGPLAQAIGERISSVIGIDEDLPRRLARIHSPIDATEFRLRQMGYSVATLVAGAAITAIATPPPLIASLLLLGAPALAVLIPEQQLSSAGARWQRRLVLELPVVAEQLGMLLSAGFSLGSAIDRLATRGDGAAARDLRRVAARVRYGASEIDALREWGALVSVPAVERLTSVLALNRDTGDLGRLIAEEARAIRRDTQRELIESIERKAQLVWIPVTVAALLPGTLFLVVPFIEAMRLFTDP